MLFLTSLLPTLLLLTPTLALPQAAATSTTTLAPSPTCTTGPPPSETDDGSIVPSVVNNNVGVITNYTRIRPMDATGAGYLVFPEWYAEHLVSGPHWMGYKHVTEPYGPSQCQYLCNAAGAECAAFFAWYEEVDTELEHMNCVLFDALITPDIFVFNSNNTIASGGYDRICQA